MGRKEQYFVNIQSPTSLRRQLLQCMKVSIEDLQRFVRFKGLRDQKLQKLMELKAVLKEINAFDGRLRQMLPTRDNKAQKITGKKESPMQALRIDSSMMELDQLEKAVSKIEEKLKTLDSMR